LSPNRLPGFCPRTPLVSRLTDEPSFQILDAPSKSKVRFTFGVRDVAKILQCASIPSLEKTLHEIGGPRTPGTPGSVHLKSVPVM